MIYLNQCTFCKHYCELPEGSAIKVPRANESWDVQPFCLAFPDGIPDKIWEDRFDHSQPFKGDNGITFLAVSTRSDEDHKRRFSDPENDSQEQEESS